MFNPQQKHGVLWVRWYRIFEPCPLQWKNSLCRAQLACSDQAMCAETPGQWTKMAENGFRMILSLIGNATLGILWAIPQVAPGRQMTQMTQMTPQKTAQARAWTKTLRY